jgi:hypothetical protein
LRSSTLAAPAASHAGPDRGRRGEQLAVLAGALSSGWSIAVRVLLVVAIAGSCIAVVVQIVSLARWFTGNTPHSGHMRRTLIARRPGRARGEPKRVRATYEVIDWLFGDGHTALPQAMIAVAQAVAITSGINPDLAVLVNKATGAMVLDSPQGDFTEAVERVADNGVLGSRAGLQPSDAPSAWSESSCSTRPERTGQAGSRHDRPPVHADRAAPPRPSWSSRSSLWCCCSRPHGLPGPSCPPSAGPPSSTSSTGLSSGYGDRRNRGVIAQGGQRRKVRGIRSQRHYRLAASTTHLNWVHVAGWLVVHASWYGGNA